MKPQRGNGSLFKFKNSRVWWVKFYRDGVPVRESTHTPNLRRAEKFLKDRLAEIRDDTYVEPRDRNVSVAELYALLLADYKNKNQRSTEGLEQRWKKRLDRFAVFRATNITTQTLNQYIDSCRAEKLSNGTINRDLAAVRRMFYLGLETGKIRRVPRFPHLAESEPRTGFVEEPQYRQLSNHARLLWLRALIATAYTFGFRKGELLNLRCRQLDLAEKSIRLERKNTKNKKPRIVLLTSEIHVLLQALMVGKGPDDFVFSRGDGKQPIRDFRVRWEHLCMAAGLGRRVCPRCREEDEYGDIHYSAVNGEGKCSTCSQVWKNKQLKWDGLLFHDLRRSAVRNMIRRGIPQKVAMEISGHVTDSVFARYNIVDSTDLAEAARRIELGSEREKNFPLLLGRAEFGQSAALDQVQMGNSQAAATPPLNRAN